MAMPAMCSAPLRCAAGATCLIVPSVTSIRTSLAQPSGRSTWLKKNDFTKDLVGALDNRRQRPLCQDNTREVPMRFDRIWLDARLATLASAQPGLGIVEPGAIAAVDGRIAFVGRMADLPADWDAAETINLDGRWVTPGLIDCHTHLVYGGDRA